MQHSLTQMFEVFLSGKWLEFGFKHEMGPPSAQVTTATTATGVPVTMSKGADGFLSFTMQLEIAADAIILR